MELKELSSTGFTLCEKLINGQTTEHNFGVKEPLATQRYIVGAVRLLQHYSPFPQEPFDGFKFCSLSLSGPINSSEGHKTVKSLDPKVCGCK